MSTAIDSPVSGPRYAKVGGFRESSTQATQPRAVFGVPISFDTVCIAQRDRQKRNLQEARLKAFLQQPAKVGNGDFDVRCPLPADLSEALSQLERPGRGSDENRRDSRTRPLSVIPSLQEPRGPEGRSQLKMLLRKVGGRRLQDSPSQLQHQNKIFSTSVECHSADAFFRRKACYSGSRKPRLHARR